MLMKKSDAKTALYTAAIFTLGLAAYEIFIRPTPKQKECIPSSRIEFICEEFQDQCPPAPYKPYHIKVGTCTFSVNYNSEGKPIVRPEE